MSAHPSLSVPNHPDRGRGTLVAARAVGAALWGALLVALMTVTAALDRAGDSALALLAVAVVTALAVLVPARLRHATRGGVAGRAAAEGATTLQRATAPGQAAVLSALAVACLVGLMTDRAAGAPSVTATYLVGAVALLVALVGVAVVFPGAWLMPGRPWRGGRRLWVPALLGAIALVYPGAYALWAGGTAAIAAAPSLGWDVAAIILAGAVSAAGMGLALVLLPRPFGAVDVDARGERAVTARAGGGWLVDVASGTRLARFVEGRRCARFSPDGALFALDAGDGEVVVRRSVDGALVRRLGGAPRELQALAFAWDGASLAAVGEPSWVAVWDLAGDDDRAARYPTLTPYGRSLAFTQDGQALLVASGAGVAARLPLAAGGAPQALHRPPVDAQVARAVLSPTGRGLACAVGAGMVWSRVTALQLQAAHQTPAWAHDIGETVRVLAYGPAGEHLAVASLRSDVRLYDRAGALVAVHEEIGGTVASLAVDASGQRVVIGGRWALRRWDRRDDTIAFLAGTGEPAEEPAAPQHAVSV